MSDRLQVGRVVRVEDVALIPILRVKSSVSGSRGAIGTITPEAVVAIADGQPRAWCVDGNPKSLERLLENLPDLTSLIAGLKR